MTGPLHPSLEDHFRHVDSSVDHDPEHAEEGQSMASGDTYEPGPSFVEDDHPTERLTDMPAWLQSFAAQETTRNEESETSPDVSAAPVSVAVEDQPAMVEPDSLLPDWLRDQGETPDEALDDFEPASTMDFLSGFDDPEELDTEGFISEDDLPDWLRAFSDESNAPGPVSPEITRLPAARNVPQTGSAVVRVPPVENIWLSAYERQALGPGGTLFALLASNGNGAVTHSQTAGGETFQQEAVASSRGQKEPAGQARRAEAAGESDEPTAEKQSNSLRLVLLTLLVVLLVVAISFWQFS